MLFGISLTSLKVPEKKELTVKPWRFSSLGKSTWNSCRVKFWLTIIFVPLCCASPPLSQQKSHVWSVWSFWDMLLLHVWGVSTAVVHSINSWIWASFPPAEDLNGQRRSFVRFTAVIQPPVMRFDGSGFPAIIRWDWYQTRRKEVGYVYDYCMFIYTYFWIYVWSTGSPDFFPFNCMKQQKKNTRTGSQLPQTRNQKTGHAPLWTVLLKYVLGTVLTSLHGGYYIQLKYILKG